MPPIFWSLMDMSDTVCFIYVSLLRNTSSDVLEETNKTIIEYWTSNLSCYHSAENVVLEEFIITFLYQKILAS